MRQMTNFFGFTMLLGILVLSCGSSSTNKDSANAGTGQDSKAVSANDSAKVSEASVSTTCQADTDCAKDKCCHAAACVSTSSAPDCKEAMCSQDCKDGTMDCGKGSCACVDGTCAVKWAN